MTELILSLERVQKNFGGLLAVDELTMKILQGQICGLIGPNGAGKTTVFNLITGVHRAAQGTISLGGEEITFAKPYQITRLGIARTFQTIRLFPSLSTLEHLLVAQNCPAHHRPENRDALQKTPLDDAGDLLRLFGLWEVRHQRAVTLPYGSQRKVEMARALSTRPRLLLLDEPVAGMNLRESEELLGIISNIREMGITVLVIDHDMKFVMGLCDYLFVLDFGRKIAEGTPEEIRRDECVLQAYLGKEE